MEIKYLSVHLKSKSNFLLIQWRISSLYWFGPPKKIKLPSISLDRLKYMLLHFVNLPAQKWYTIAPLNQLFFRPHNSIGKKFIAFQSKNIVQYLKGCENPSCWFVVYVIKRGFSFSVDSSCLRGNQLSHT